ncbi:MAG TPA: PQQ-dependent sugar dehydrogenase [Gammaproteobacteria bacterium]
MKTTIFGLAGLVVVSVALPAFAQRDVPMRNGIPVAPDGLVVPPLPKEPIVYDTAEGQRIRVSVVARDLEQPWSIAFLPGGDMLVTERPGRLRLIRDGRLVPEPVEGVPEVVARGISAGLFDVALHPNFETNRYVYFAYTKAVDDGTRLAIARGRWDGHRLVDVDDVFLTRGGASRLAFGHDGMLYASASGTVLRLTPDGDVPADNPFVGDDRQPPEVFTFGHRSTIGLAVHPLTGEIWQNENGPNGGDEINVLKPGADYGWPRVSLGRDYEGPWHSERFQEDGVEDPIVYWMPSIAVSGLTFYTGDALPAWKGDVFVGSLRTGEIPGTGHVERIVFNLEMQELRREWLLADLRQRIRDIRMGPDELLYVLTGEDDGAVLRIEPAD